MPGFYTDLAASIAGQASPNSLATDLASGIGPREILGSNLVEWWDSMAGVGLVSGAVDTWTGQKLGVVLSAPAAGQRPVYGADGTNFGSASVVQCARTGSKYVVGTAASDIFAAGSHPFMLWVGRYRAQPIDRLRCVYAEEVGGAGFLVFGSTDDGATWRGQHSPSPVINTAAITSAAVRVSLSHRAADNKVEIGINDAAAAVASSGAALLAGVRKVYIGSQVSWPSDTSNRGLIMCAAAPTSSELAALKRYILSAWGVP